MRQAGLMNTTEGPAMTTAYIATDLRYLGKATIVAKQDDGTIIVELAKHGRGRVLASQCYSTRQEARDAVKPLAAGGGWSSAAQLGAMIR